jgi:hypothetical protein
MGIDESIIVGAEYFLPLQLWGFLFIGAEYFLPLQLWGFLFIYKIYHPAIFGDY